jgi:hypothetical protein
MNGVRSEGFPILTVLAGFEEAESRRGQGT